MVKKKAAKKAASKPARAAKTKPAKAAKPARAAKAAKKPKNEQLELIKGVRYVDLDRLCRQIGSNRDDVAALKRDGAALEGQALKAMRLHGVTGYKEAGITLMKIDGDESLRVLRDRGDKASSGSGALNQPIAPGSEPADEGEGQDAGKIGEALTDKDEE